MPDENSGWNALREFENCVPSELAFRALVALLDTWPENDQLAAVDFADRLLRDWPDSMRVAPWSWCKAASKGLVLPTWRLVRSLELASKHLSKRDVNLVQLAHHANLDQITVLQVPEFNEYQELSFLYHFPERFPALQQLQAADKHDDGDVRALADSPIWNTIRRFETEKLTDAFLYRKDSSRILPRLERTDRIEHLTLRAPDLIAVWHDNDCPNLRSASVFVRSIDEARELAERRELSQLTSLSLAFRSGFCGGSPFNAFLGNVIETDEAAAEVFFATAKLERLESLSMVGYEIGYWGREGLGYLGLNELIKSGLLHQLKHLKLQLLPLGDRGVAAMAPALGEQLERLELVDVYCKGEGAAALNQSPCMSSLRRLDLSGNRIDAEQHVAMSELNMPNLESLDLSGPRVNPYYWNIGRQPLTDKGAVSWANSRSVQQLKCLKLANCFLRDDSLTAIFSSPHMESLTELDLSHNFFTKASISESVVGSSLWRNLERLGLNDCRLDNDAIEALTQVESAGALRSIGLSYNCIGPKGAKALANWPVLSHVWQLALHDNYIGDEALIALANSKHLGRLLDLDLEQDCWNSRSFTFNDDAAAALASSTALPHLDAIFSGGVDEYHGSCYSPGFSKSALNAIRNSKNMRPAFKASCSDFSNIYEYSEDGDFDEDVEVGNRDFRRLAYELKDEDDAEAAKHKMQQLSSPFVVEEFDHQQPPKVSKHAPQPDLVDRDIIEGLEFVEAIPVTESSFDLELSLEDVDRPLPGQVAKYLGDTLESYFKACSIGYFQLIGGGCREDETGQTIETDVAFSFGVKGDPEPAAHCIRETLWWIGTPANTEIADLALSLNKKPSNAVTRFLQLASPEVARWMMFDQPGHRIDRVALSQDQRKGVSEFISEYDSVEFDGGWATISASDGGRLQIYVKYMSDNDEFDTLNMLVDVLSPESSKFIYRLMRDFDFMLLPMAFAASDKVAQRIDCEWPEVATISSAEKLYSLLDNGPFDWWSRQKQ